MVVSKKPQTPAETMQSLDGKSMEAVVEILKAELQKRKKDVAFKVFDPCDKLTEEIKKYEDGQKIKKQYESLYTDTEGHRRTPKQLYTDTERKQILDANSDVMNEFKIAFVKVTDVLQKTKIFLNRS